MHLVVDHMVQLQHVDVTHCGRLVKRFARFAVVELHTAVVGQTCLAHVLVDLLQRSAVEDRRGELQSEFVTSPTEYSLVNLTKVHT